MIALPPAVTTASYRVSQGETAAVTGYHRATQSEALRAQATRARASTREAVTRPVALTALAALLAVVVGLVAMAVGEWQFAFAGVLIAMVGILTAGVTASIVTERMERR